MNARNGFRRGPADARGATLIVGLVFLVILTVIGVAALRMAGLEERMAGGTRDRALAFQAAEAALRDAERDILSERADGTICVPGTDPFPSAAQQCRPAAARPYNQAGKSGWDQNCGSAGSNTQGQCYRNPLNYFPTPVWRTLWNAAVQYGTFTGSAAMDGVAQQPQYLMEIFDRSVLGTPRYYYRITARGVGLTASSVVLLQEVFVP